MKKIILGSNIKGLDDSTLLEIESRGFEVIREDGNFDIITPAMTKEIVSGKAIIDHGLVIMKRGDWTIIPLENLIASLHGKGKQIGILVENPSEVPTYLNILEKGVDALYFEDKKVLNDSLNFLTGTQEKMDLKIFKVMSIEDAGSGDRACIDTLTMLDVNEGVFLGSFSRNMVLVLSENLKNDYIETRPFRINSGSIHQYVYIGNGKTKYLSELVSGTKIMVFNSGGKGRNSVVGRSKIEFRPMLKIRYSDEKDEGVVFLQNAETVRLMGKDGNSLPVTKLKVGDEIIGISLIGARHYGMAVDEKLIEI